MKFKLDPLATDKIRALLGKTEEEALYVLGVKGESYTEIMEKWFTTVPATAEWPEPFFDRLIFYWRKSHILNYRLVEGWS